MARFEREAKVLASLNHHHIASIHGLEEAGSMRALVMEVVEGPTLAERIEQGSIPIEEAITIAKQIAEALEYAHERSIIHRDLKPANVKLTAISTGRPRTARGIRGYYSKANTASSQMPGILVATFSRTPCAIQTARTSSSCLSKTTSPRVSGPASRNPC